MIDGTVSARTLGVVAVILGVLLGLFGVVSSHLSLRHDQSLSCVTARDDVPVSAPVKGSTAGSHVRLFPPQLWCEMPGQANSQFLAAERDWVWLYVVPATALIGGGLTALFLSGPDKRESRQVAPSSPDIPR